MNYTLHTQSGRWLASLSCASFSCATIGGPVREFAITLRPSHDGPDPAGRLTIEQFFNDLDTQWCAVVNALAAVDSSLTRDIIDASLQEKIHLFAPAQVGSQWHEFLMLFNLSLPKGLSAMCIICMDEGVITHAEVQR